MLPSFTPRAMSKARSACRYSTASSAERRSGSDTISMSGDAGPVEVHDRAAVLGDVVDVLAGVLLHVDAGEADRLLLPLDIEGQGTSRQMGSSYCEIW